MIDFAVTVRDSVLYDHQADEQLFTLFFPKKTITAKELIRERIFHEVQAYNDRLPDVFRGLIVPADAERVLNGYKRSKKHPIDPEKQCRLAWEAFKQNGFILLVDERQVSDLNEKIEINSGSTVVFLKLTSLVGG